MTGDFTMDKRDLLLLLGFSEKHIKCLEQLDITNDLRYEPIREKVTATRRVDLTNIIVDRMTTSFITEPILIDK
jgi:hypothetical protein